MEKILLGDSKNILIAKAGRNWTIKSMIDNVLNVPLTWNGLSIGVTVCEHKYTHEGNGGYYDVELKEFDNKTWLIYECSIPQSIKAGVRNILKDYHLKYHRVMDASAMNDWVNSVYNALGQLVQKENLAKERQPYLRQSVKTRFKLLYTSIEYRAYKALVDKLACEQLEDYYQHVMEVKL